jgi:chromosome segregation ATPase
MQGTIDTLIKDNKRRDEAISRASGIIESVHAENKMLKGKLREKDEFIDELRKNERAMESRFVAIQAENLTITKLRTVETKLRSEIEGLKLENELLSEDRGKTEQDLRVKLGLLEKELKSEKALKEKILNDISELSTNEKVSNNLVEDYITQLREVEKDNSDLSETVSKLSSENARLIEQHRKEMASLVEANKKTLELFKGSAAKYSSDHEQFSFQSSGSNYGSRSVSAAKSKLMLDNLYSALSSFAEMNSFVGRLGIEELEDLSVFKDRLEEYTNLLKPSDSAQKESRLVRELRENIEEYRKVVDQQAGLIKSVVEENYNLQSTVNHFAKLIDQKVEELSRASNGLYEEQKSTQKNISRKMFESLTIYQEEYNRSLDLIRKTEGLLKAGVREHTSLSDAVDLLLDKLGTEMEENRNRSKEGTSDARDKEELLMKLKELIGELSQKNSELDILNESIDELERENLNLRKDFKNYQEDTDEFKKRQIEKIKDLEGENSKLIQKCEDFALKSISKGRTGLEERRSNSKESEADVFYENKQLRSEVSSLQYRLKEKEFEGENLQEQLSVRKERVMQLVKEQQLWRDKEGGMMDEIYRLKKELNEVKRGGMQTSFSQRSSADYGLDQLNPAKQANLGYYFKKTQDGSNLNDSANLKNVKRRLYAAEDDHEEEEEDLEEFERKLLSNNEFD